MFLTNSKRLKYRHIIITIIIIIIIILTRTATSGTTSTSDIGQDTDCSDSSRPANMSLRNMELGYVRSFPFYRQFMTTRSPTAVGDIIYWCYR
jgi:hypothetical protein